MKKLHSHQNVLDFRFESDSSKDHPRKLMEINQTNMDELDLPAYLRRIEYSGDLRPNQATLEALHLAHAAHIPFENLDIFLARPIRLDLASLQAKLVQGGRGGYCFEQNTLFAAVLEQLGFTLTRLAARVLIRGDANAPRTHMLLLAEIAGKRWLADVGFGAGGLLLPMMLDPQREARQYAWTHRVIEQAGQWLLQSLQNGDWKSQYAFTLEPQQAVDYEIANYYVSTHPESVFVKTLTAQRLTPQGRHALRNFQLNMDDGVEVVSRMLENEYELLDVLARIFGLHFPAGTRFLGPQSSVTKP